MNLMFWRVCVAVSHRTSVDIYCTSQSPILAYVLNIDPNKNFHRILPSEQVQVQDLFVTYTIIQRVYNQQWNVSQVRSMDSANIIE